MDRQGNVRARTVGRAIITARAHNGVQITRTVNVQANRVTGVRLNATSANITVGNGRTLVAVVQPLGVTNRGVTWSSSNPTIASVNANGRVTASRVGTTTITVTTIDGNRQANITINVQPIDVTGVRFNSATASMTLGTERTLNAVIAPINATDQRLTWQSSSTTVAQVNQNGRVTTVRPGTTTITVTTRDGNHRAQIQLTVNPIRVTDVDVVASNTLIPTASSYGIGPVSLSVSTRTFSIRVGSVGTLNAVISPWNATNRSVTWTNLDPGIVSINASKGL